MALGSMGGDIVSKVSNLGKDLSWLTGTAGFIYGVDAKFTPTAGPGYPFTTQGIGDVIAGIAGNATAKKILGAAYTGTATQVFNPGAILNHGTYIAVGLYFLKDIWPSKFTKMAYNLGFAPALGYGVGRIFDDPIASSQSLTGPGQNAYPVGNYSSSSRNGLPVNSGPSWIDAQ